ncbi:hypothetical protein FB45DRAFT_769378 [Roridomyces roridus]|uniref:CxC2-like cysteine cluster KDZ transposase-associated domain-containing protein n=1 Tax=Roridomyces roridus TaxID=1738132 RepID=A0AAD7F864_9AGAR|nr:hypothetical protein FB45DRAFT_769378 [Roridomyces roridus]
MDATDYVYIQDRPLLPFRRVRNDILDAFIRREGRGLWWNKGCMNERCLSLEADYRCRDCFGGRLLCHSCVVEKHSDEPLHCIERWKDNYFQRCSVSSLDPSLRFQIGHPPGELCDFRDGPHPMVLLDNNGIHQLHVDYCGCIGAPSVNDQLINVGWFPATVTAPETCATLSLLRRFHTLNLQARVAAYDFYSSLEVLTDGAGLLTLPDRREQFTLMVREYRHVQMCKRAGRGHDCARIYVPDTDSYLSGIDATEPGGLQVPCRACPIPQVNLPEDYENAPADEAWLYQLMLSQDANFKLKGRDTSSRDKDPALGPGFAYVVANDAYLKHLSKYVDEDEISHCVAFAALWRANNKRARGLRATGIGSVSCSRHELFRANGTGDLQKGERYSNMDYIFHMSILGITLASIIASYDIACQWCVNFWNRSKKLPSHLQLPVGLKIQFKVPKFHLPPHVKKCHGPFSFNYTKWAGRTDGEGVERNWSWLNMIARSVSVMGPGSREDTIDDFCGYANWRKTVGYGDSLLRKLVLAIPKAILHGQAFQAFTEGVREGHEEELRQWETEVREWEMDNDKPCPYEYPEDENISMDRLRLLIRQEDHARAEQGESTTSPGAFIITAMEIEEQQCAIRLESRRRERTSTQAADLQRRRTQALNLVRRFQDEQVRFMPGLKRHLEASGVATVEESTARPEEMKLHLPSSFPADVREAICIAALPAEEERLREAQAWDGLRDLRRQLRTRMLAHQFKRAHTSGQAAYTKSQQLHEGIEQRIRGAASTYRRARIALLALRGSGPWAAVLQELTQQDIRGMNERTLTDQEKEDDRRARVLAGQMGDDIVRDVFGDAVEPTVRFNLEVGEGNRLLSWIWYAGGAGPGSTTTTGKLHDDIRMEWLKARARAHRWREDLLLLDEEMRRVLAFCQWKADWWDTQMTARSVGSEALAEGLRAYAAEQAARERHWHTAWEEKWRLVRQRARDTLQSDGVDFAQDGAISVELDDEIPYGEGGDENEDME